MINHATKTIQRHTVFSIILAVLIYLIAAYFSFWLGISLAALFLVLFSLAGLENGLFFLVAYIPFQIALNPASNIDLASGRVFILLLFTVFIVGGLVSYKKLNLLKLDFRSWLLLIFLFLACLSVIEAEALEPALRKILVFVSIFPLYFLVTSLVDSREKIIRLVRVLVFSGLIASLIGLIQFLSQFMVGLDSLSRFWADKIVFKFLGRSFGAQVLETSSWVTGISGKWFFRAISFFPDPHTFSFYIGLILPIAIVLLAWQFLKPHGRRNSTRKALLFIVNCLLLIVALLTFSRGGYLGMGFSIIVMTILGWRFLGPKAKIAVFCLFMVGMLFLTIPNPISIRFLSIFSFQESAIARRIEIWQKALEMFKDNFWLGIGIGNYYLKIDPTASFRVPYYAHNTYLDVGVEMGIFSLVVWLLLFGIILFQLIRNTLNYANEDVNKRKDLISVLSMGLVGSLVWFLVHCFFDTPIYSPRVLPILMVILGLTTVVTKMQNAKRKVQNNSAKLKTKKRYFEF